MTVALTDCLATDRQITV